MFMKTKPKVKLVPLPKSFMRAAVAGEFLANLAALDPASIQQVQSGVATGRVRSIMVEGYNSRGLCQTRHTLHFDPLTNDTTLHIDLGNGTKSHIEALDEGIAAVVSHALATHRRRQLVSRVSVDWVDDRPKAPPAPAPAPSPASNFAPPEYHPQFAANQARAQAILGRAPVPPTTYRPDGTREPYRNDTPLPTYQPVFTEPPRTAPPTPPSAQPPRSFLTKLLSIRAGKDDGIRLTVEEARSRK